MGGSMARKESRATNGHPAELKKEEETAVQQLAVRRSLLLWGPAYLREHPGILHQKDTAQFVRCLSFFALLLVQPDAVDAVK